MLDRVGHVAAAFGRVRRVVVRVGGVLVCHGSSLVGLCCSFAWAMSCGGCVSGPVGGFA